MSNDLLTVVIAQGNKLHYGSKKRAVSQNMLQLIVTSVKRKQRHKRVRVLGYVDLVANYLDDDFKSHFRMSRITMNMLITEVGNELSRMHEATHTGRPQQSITLQCLICIWVLANQESYRSIADRFNVAKSTVFNCMIRICKGLNELAKNIIKWPRRDESAAIIDGFKKKKNFPGVLGAIDGSHIHIKPPEKNSATYLNRKGTASMLLQAVCNNSGSFIDVFVGFPGSVHDVRVFQKSGMLQRCSDAQYFPHNSHLLGDSAYPLGEHILVPFKDNGHLTRKQITYNIAHATTRVVIERTFGILKGRWRRLKYLELHNANFLPDVIMSTCVLHNFCIKHSDDSPDMDIGPSSNGMEEDHPICGINTRNKIDGERKRTFILNSL